MASGRELSQYITRRLFGELSQEEQEHKIKLGILAARELKIIDPDILDIILFGSFARRSATRFSDLDLAVVYADDYFVLDIRGGELHSKMDGIMERMGVRNVIIHLTPVGKRWLEEPSLPYELPTAIIEAIIADGRSLINESE